VSVSTTLKLPDIAPRLLSGNNLFTLSVVQDADYLTSQVYPHVPSQGNGADSTQVTITTPSFASNPTPALPDLAVLNVQTPTPNIKWGQNFQVTATIENLGSGNVGTYRVRYLLVGNDGSLNNSLFLGDALLSGLQAGYAQSISQTLQLPSKV